MKEYREETAQCAECGKITPFTDEGGRCEINEGWLCNDCIDKLTREGWKLIFADGTTNDM